MSVIVDLDQSKVETFTVGDEVAVLVNDIYAGAPLELRLDPAGAVQLSRALVKAAAEALGVKQGDG